MIRFGQLDIRENSGGRHDGATPDYQAFLYYKDAEGALAAALERERIGLAAVALRAPHIEHAPRRITVLPAQPVRLAQPQTGVQDEVEQ